MSVVTAIYHIDINTYRWGLTRCGTVSHLAAKP